MEGNIYQKNWFWHFKNAKTSIICYAKTHLSKYSIYITPLLHWMLMLCKNASYGKGTEEEFVLL